MRHLLSKRISSQHSVHQLWLKFKETCCTLVIFTALTKCFEDTVWLRFASRFCRAIDSKIFTTLPNWILALKTPHSLALWHKPFWSEPITTEPQNKRFQGKILSFCCSNKNDSKGKKNISRWNDGCVKRCFPEFEFFLKYSGSVPVTGGSKEIPIAYIFRD